MHILSELRRCEEEDEVVLDDAHDEDNDRAVVQGGGIVLAGPIARRAGGSVARWVDLSPHSSSVRPPASLAQEGHTTCATPPPSSLSKPLLLSEDNVRVGG